jgi:hypothetical protein
MYTVNELSSVIVLLCMQIHIGLMERLFDLLDSIFRQHYLATGGTSAHGAARSANLQHDICVQRYVNSMLHVFVSLSSTVAENSSGCVDSTGSALETGCENLRRSTFMTVSGC